MAGYFGMGYPIVKSPKGYFPVTNDVELVKGDLLMLLLTNPGERVMMPQFGTPLATLLFDPNDAFLAEKARNMIINSISRWEPRIVIDAINVSTGISQRNRGFLNPNDDFSQANNILGIQILFRFPSDIRSVQELVLQVPLQGGGTNGNIT
jgi:phage baseplate assembly protein W